VNLQRTRLPIWLITVAVLLLQGCATLNAARGGPGQKLDPWENWNRKVFSFNESVDDAVLKPVATAYSNVVPQPVRDGVNNFFGNFSDAWSAFNSFLQGKVGDGATGVIRVGTNTVFGLLGVLDVAGEMGISRGNEDFGQTLGHWGVGPGAYVVWPILGPSTVRESFALPLDRSVSPALVINDGGSQGAISVLQVINLRASLLGASKVVDDIALDKYTFVRDGYLQRRRSLVFDGEDPPEPEEPLDDADSPASAPK
jgi:phospholipid-binding lipoprotein MlaA